MKQIKREKVWEERFIFGDEAKDKQIDEMALKMGVSKLFAVLLYNRGYKTEIEAERFLRLEQSDFHDPYLLVDMDKAVDRIFAAIENKEKICIYGDYDVDGVTSVTVLYLYLKELSADVSFRIPKREGEGYGVSCNAVRELAEEGVDLIITVDTGITASAEIEYAKSLSMDFVVTDHHECHTEIPKACAVVNPHRPDCPYPFKELAGVGVVFKLVSACEIKRCRMSGESVVDGMRRVCRNYADLTAVGTIADVMSVVDENRLIVSLGLKLMSERPRAGFAALMAASSTKGGADKKITSGMIGFGIAPRLNAAGRISDAAIAVELLLETDEKKAIEAADRLCEINKHRQSEENKIALAAYEQIEDTIDPKNDLVIVLDSYNWHQGIIGIVSSRITEKYGLPSILISFDGDEGSEDPFDDGKGSGRSIKGLNLVDALSYCSDLLVKYGGHELAAGLTVKRGNLDAFRDKINEYARSQFTEDMFKIRMEADMELSMKDLTMSFAEEISALEPFGIGNVTPSFILRDAKVKKIAQMGGGKHTRLTVEKNGDVATALYFGVGETELGFGVGDSVDLLFNIDINDYKNIRSVQMVLQDARVAESYEKEEKSQKQRYAQLCAGEEFKLSEDFIPTREDCAAVYKTLRREYRLENSVIDIRTLMRAVNGDTKEKTINYVKLKYILRIFNELRICEAEEIDNDIYRFCIFFNASKTSIDKSAILKKLKSQCKDRHGSDQNL